MPKVLISDAMDPIAEKILKEKNIDVDVLTDLSVSKLLDIIPIYDGLIVRSATKVTRQVIEKSNNLKIIGRAGAGVDNIDLVAAKENKIIVINTPGGNTNATAEHTLALLLSLFRKIPKGNKSTHEGLWEKKKLKGNEIKGKTIGIIGFGNVGKKFAEMCYFLGLNILIKSKTFEKYKQDYPNYKSVDLKTILIEADIISFHCKPNIDGTSIINNTELDMMKNNAFIINTARGNMVSEKDLFDALQKGKIKGAALDVFNEEPAKKNILFGLENIILTPHIAASTEESQIIVAEMVANQFADYFNNNKIINEVIL